MRKNVLFRKLWQSLQPIHCPSSILREEFVVSSFTLVHIQPHPTCKVIELLRLNLEVRASHNLVCRPDAGLEQVS